MRLKCSLATHIIEEVARLAERHPLRAHWLVYQAEHDRVGWLTTAKTPKRTEVLQSGTMLVHMAGVAMRGGVLLKRILVVTLSCGGLAAQVKGPERQVEGNVITSERDPRVRIQLPKSVQYVGADRWVLYGIADCELHAFVEADGQKSVQRLYWVQFEGYVPTKPELKHEYDSLRHTEIGGMDFYVDTWVRPNDAETRPGSDLEHIEALIRAKGYRMPAGMMDVRLVHLLDEQKRQELMIIYSEDVAPTGLTVADLRKGGTAYDRWPAIENGLVERAEERIAIEKTRGDARCSGRE